MQITQHLNNLFLLAVQKGKALSRLLKTSPSVHTRPLPGGNLMQPPLCLLSAHQLSPVSGPDPWVPLDSNTAAAGSQETEFCSQGQILDLSSLPFWRRGAALISAILSPGAHNKPLPLLWMLNGACSHELIN